MASAEEGEGREDGVDGAARMRWYRPMSLTEEIEILSAAFDAGALGIAVVERTEDNAVMVLGYNDACAKAYGSRIPLGTVMARSPLPAFLPDRVTPMPAEQRPLLRAMLKGETVRDVPTHVPGDDGVWRVILVSAIPVVRAGQPDVRRVVLTFHEVTEQKRAEEARRRSETRYATLVEQAADAVFVHDIEGRLLEVNRRACENLGYSQDELLQMRVTDVDVEFDAEAVQRAWSAIRPGAPVSSVGSHRRKDGTIFPVEIHVAAMDIGGERLFMAIVRDLTELRAMQAHVAQTDRLASVGTLAAGVAHEINNPLTYVIGALDRIGELLGRGELGADAAREIADALAQADEGTRRVRSVVQDLTTFARTRDDKRASVRLEPILETAVSLAGNEIRHRARLVRLYSDAPPVLAEEARLGQVFLNLLINASQAMPEGRADHHEIHVVTRTDADGRALVEIRDTGAGIPPEILGRVFDPFFTTKPVGSGTGLGLSICRNIVTSLGGEIQVESRLGQGTTVRVLLPATELAAQAAPQRAPSPGRGRRGKVLVVDDEPMIGRLVARILKAEHDVSVLGDAREALARIEGGERFDVILCDLMMPEMTGMDLHAALLAGRPEEAEKMVLLTGGAFTPAAKDFLASVPNPRVEKPFEQDALRALIRRLVG
ncbi:MAG: PAS domain S-box protein [Byssovorax sp.]